MTPASAARMIRRRGRPVLLRRIGPPLVEVAVTAMIRPYEPAELVNGVMLGDQELRIGSADLVEQGYPLPIAAAAGDWASVDGVALQVVEVAVMYVGTLAAIHVLRMRGA